MKNFVIALVFTLIASCSATPQENPRRNLSYIGWSVEQVQKDTPVATQLKADDALLLGEPELAEYGETWIAYAFRQGPKSVKLFKFELADSLCFEEQTHTSNSCTNLTQLVVYDLFMESDLTDEGKGVLINIPHNPNKRMLFEYSWYEPRNYAVFKVKAIKPIIPFK